MRIAMSINRALSLVALALMLGSACVVGSWKAPLGRNHPLTGRIWDVSAAQFIDRENLVSRLTRADFLLLGEKHDNPDHHRLQAEVLRSLVAAGRRPAVGFEMFGVDDAAAIAQHLAATPNDAAGLGRAVNWNQRGWPDWEMYQVIAEAALAAELPIIAANLPLATTTNMRRDGLAALEPALIRRLGLDRPLPEPAFTRLAADIRESHCGYGSKESVAAMVTIQRARDAQMAQSLMAAGASRGALLVAGAGHVRNDYGIPVYINENAPGKRVISIAFVDVDKRRSAPQDYAAQEGSGRIPFDYVWFTPRMDDEDPCEKFKSQFENLKKSGRAN
jgi:uncharacterized iron-regulated protein